MSNSALPDRHESELLVLMDVVDELGAERQHLPARQRPRQPGPGGPARAEHAVAADEDRRRRPAAGSG